jgi:hypothetical protein
MTMKISRNKDLLQQIIQMCEHKQILMLPLTSMESKHYNGEDGS